jgi:hypothetical protein
LWFEASQGKSLTQDPILKKPFTKRGAGGVARGKGPEFKPQFSQKIK